MKDTIIINPIHITDEEPEEPDVIIDMKDCNNDNFILDSNDLDIDDSVLKCPMCGRTDFATMVLSNDKHNYHCYPCGHHWANYE